MKAAVIGVDGGVQTRPLHRESGKGQSRCGPQGKVAWRGCVWKGRSKEGRALTLHKAAACSDWDRGGQDRSDGELGLRLRLSKFDDRGYGGGFRGGGGGALCGEAAAGAANGLLLVELLLIHDHRLACARGRECAWAGEHDCRCALHKRSEFVRRAVRDQGASHARALSGVRAACVRVCVRTYDSLESGNDRAHKTIDECGRVCVFA